MYADQAIIAATAHIMGLAINIVNSRTNNIIRFSSADIGTEPLKEDMYLGLLSDTKCRCFELGQHDQ